MKLHIIIVALGLFSSMAVSAQIDEFRKKYEEFKQKARQEYNEFRDEANRQYAEFMLTAWKQYKTLPVIPKPKDEDIKPVVMPEEDKEKNIESNPIKIEEIVKPPVPEPQPVPVAPIRDEPEIDKKYVFTFYGVSCSVRMNDNAKFSMPDYNVEQMSATWKKLSEGTCNNTIRDCLEHRIRLQLSDWAYINFLEILSENIYGKSNEAVFLMSYIYCQSGYMMRLGVSDNKLYMLYASTHAIYNMPYFQIDGVNYYPYKCNEKSMHICDVSFPEERPLSLMISSNHNFGYSATQSRTLNSERYKDLSVEVSVNKNLIDFYNTYPSSEVDDNFMTRWAMYANTPMEKEVVETLYPKLRQYISGLSEKEAVERILNWVQTAFVYEYDDKVWGQDRAFFAEESLYYPFCDCEDRSILFTRIVRDLLNLDCILIYYPGHLASAVSFSDKVDGDYIMLDNKRFIVCDATYIGAPVGMTMPGMDNKKANVILLY